MNARCGCPTCPMGVLPVPYNAETGACAHCPLICDKPYCKDNQIMVQLDPKACPTCEVQLIVPCPYFLCRLLNCSESQSVMKTTTGCGCPQCVDVFLMEECVYWTWNNKNYFFCSNLELASDSFGCHWYICWSLRYDISKLRIPIFNDQFQLFETKHQN